MRILKLPSKFSPLGDRSAAEEAKDHKRTKRESPALLPIESIDSKTQMPIK